VLSAKAAAAAWPPFSPSANAPDIWAEAATALLAGSLSTSVSQSLAILTTTSGTALCNNSRVSGQEA
jgi:hypothetical protein